MKILVIGSGGGGDLQGLEVKSRPRVKKIYCAPGYCGIGYMAELVPIGPEEIEKLADFATKEKIDLTVVGPELPLTLGIANLFQQRGLKIFGPDREAARLEGSKAFAKEILKENRIPTASFATFSEASSAKRYLGEQKPPYVVKADGLAAGKGVIICADRKEAEAAIEDILVRKLFSQAGESLVIE